MTASTSTTMRPSISIVTRAVDEADRKLAAEQAAADMSKANIRGAAALNYIDLCRCQAGRRDFNDRDFQCLRVILSAGDELFRLDGDDAIVPAGFGSAVRSVQSGKLAAVARELDAAVESAAVASAD